MANGSGNVNNVLQYSGINSITNGQNGTQVIPIQAIDTTGFVAIGMGINVAISNDYYAFYASTPSAAPVQYQVPTSKIFYVTDIWITSGAANVVNIGYGTAALIANPTATAPTGKAMWFNDGTTATGTPFVNAGAVGTIAQHYSFPGISFPALSYPMVQLSSADAYRIIICGIVK